MSELKAKEYKQFEDINHIRADGSEYWRAREFASVLDYTKWENFTKVIDRAILACKNSDFGIFIILTPYGFSSFAVSAVVSRYQITRPLRITPR
ncbi:MAG: hypothetical protein LBT32_02430 [Peptococcaceae bacterium]|jgi:DNA-damage-inducible protein D|nr:hypothetical protein [Peptococcaceae bacterium]